MKAKGKNYGKREDGGGGLNKCKILLPIYTNLHDS